MFKFGNCGFCSRFSQDSRAICIAKLQFNFQAFIEIGDLFILWSQSKGWCRLHEWKWLREGEMEKLIVIKLS